MRIREARRRVYLKPSRYIHYETGTRPLTIEAALRICDEYGLSLDWFYRDDRSRLPHHLPVAIARIEAVEL